MPRLSDTETFESLSRVADRVFDRVYRLGYDCLTSEEQAFFCVWSAAGQIDNGGFHQFYFNSSGDWAVETALAFGVIGAPVTAALVQRGNAVFPGGSPPRDTSGRRVVLEAMSDKDLAEIDALDDPYFAADEDYDALLRTYVDANPNPFSDVGV